MKRFFLYWLPVLIYAGLIFLLSSFSLRAVPKEITHFDYLIHFIEYAILSLLIYRACIHTPAKSFSQHAVFLSIIISVLYGLSDEFHQSFVPDRVISLSDFIFDSLGSLVAASLAGRFWKPRSDRPD